MEFDALVRGAGSCREFRPDPVPDNVLWELFELARFAGSGGNRQPVRFVVVREPATKRQLRDLYLTVWEPYVAAVRDGTTPNATSPATLDTADRFARALDQVPALTVVCADLGSLYFADAGLDRPSLAGGASVYPAVQNLLLACRDRGVGATFTSLLCAFEPTIADLLDIPDGVAVAGVIAMGYPVRPLPVSLRRAPVADLVWMERYGRSASCPGVDPGSS